MDYRNGLPPSPPNFNGVGSMCIDWKFKTDPESGKKILDMAESRIVMIKERFAFPGAPIGFKMWKLPGGGVDAGLLIFFSSFPEIFF